jgi:hypothetical protein
MGFLRVVFIFVGLAVCFQIGLDGTSLTPDTVMSYGTSLFRSMMAFFIMLSLDYARMWLKGVSLYEKGLGITGFIYSVGMVTINWLGESQHIVLVALGDTYHITSSNTSLLFRNFDMNLLTYVDWTFWFTMSIAGLELIVPYANRYNRATDDNNRQKGNLSRIFEPRIKVERVDRRSNKEVELNLEGNNVPQSIDR